MVTNDFCVMARNQWCTLLIIFRSPNCLDTSLFDFFAVDLNTNWNLIQFKDFHRVRLTFWFFEKEQKILLLNLLLKISNWIWKQVCEKSEEKKSKMGNFRIKCDLLKKITLKIYYWTVPQTNVYRLSRCFLSCID